MKKITIIGILAVFAVLSISAQQREFPTLAGPYLGQTPPGMKPEIFAPGIVSTDKHEFSITVSPEGDEIFFSPPAFSVIHTAGI